MDCLRRKRAESGLNRYCSSLFHIIQIMGCLCSKSALVMDVEFNVGYSPYDAMEFLRSPKNWLLIIPGAKTGILTLNPSADIVDKIAGGILVDWFLVAENLRYDFSCTKCQGSGSGDEQVWLSYCVNVSGTSMGLPINFHFSVRYDFKNMNSADGCTIRRQVTDLSVNACTCAMSCFVKSNLKSGCTKENVNMAEFMKDSKVNDITAQT